MNQKQYMNSKIGKVAEWLKAIDCKSLEFFLRRFESYLSHLQIIIQFNKQFFSDNNYVLDLILKSRTRYNSTKQIYFEFINF